MKDNFQTLHELVDNLTEYLNLNPEQQFRVTAKIKRLIHREKSDVYSRYAHYAKGMFDHETKDPFLLEILTEGAARHEDWATKKDEEIVTWDIGPHKFKQGE